MFMAVSGFGFVASLLPCGQPVSLRSAQVSERVSVVVRRLPCTRDFVTVQGRRSPDPGQASQRLGHVQSVRRHVAFSALRFATVRSRSARTTTAQSSQTSVVCEGS
jgi:hypothetical protein